MRLLMVACVAWCGCLAWGQEPAVPGKDYPYGEGVIYKRELLFGSFASGHQDGPAAEVELYGTCAQRMPSGDWYLLDDEANGAFYRYDAQKKRVVTLSHGAPYGKRGGQIQTMRFARGGYMCGMGVSRDPAGDFVYIYDRNNQGAHWQISVKTGKVSPREGATSVQNTALRATGKDGSLYFAMGDGKLKKLSADGKQVTDLGVTFEQPIFITTCNGMGLISEKTNRFYIMARDPSNPWGIAWYWDMKTGKATGLAGPSLEKFKSGKMEEAFRCASGPSDKVSFWCASGCSLGPDEGERYFYVGGGDEPSHSRIDLEKKYVHKLVPADPKDPSLWTYGEGKLGKEVRFGNPYCWGGPPGWGEHGEFYCHWALLTRVEVYRPVGVKK